MIDEIEFDREELRVAPASLFMRSDPRAYFEAEKR